MRLTSHPEQTNPEYNNLGITLSVSVVRYVVLVLYVVESGCGLISVLERLVFKIRFLTRISNRTQPQKVQSVLLRECKPKYITLL